MSATALRAACSENVVSRRAVLALGAGALAARAYGTSCAFAADATESHGLSAFGDLAYAADFPHFAYVDPRAPKGGTFTQLAGAGGATFNSLNAFILKGDPAIDLDLTFAALMARNFDEPDAVYPLAAERVRVSADGRDFHFRLRPGAAFHDGSPITAGDVAFSLTVLKDKGRPNYRAVLRDMEAAEPQDARTLLVRFAAARSRDAPILAATMPIFSTAFYAAHNFDETTLEPPLGSGPYRVRRLEQGRFLELERVKDWWGAELPAARGQYNFDVLRYEYYRDRDVAFEGFTGRNYMFREEFTSRMWATRYDFAAVRDGRVKREVIADERPAGAQGWIFNTRREKLHDRRVREALALAFDFEWTNKNIMFGSYARTHSYFQNSEMMASGMPSPEEVALLEPFRGQVPDEVFGEPWTPPVSDGSGQDRRLLRRAGELLSGAGWPVKDGKRVNARGERLSLEFLFIDRTFEPHHTTYVKNLTLLGIDATLRLVDPVQFRVRTEDFDFDMTVDRMVFPQTPGETLQTYFSSRAAGIRGSFNLAGIADPVVDAMIERAIAADSRPALVAACRALDRVLRAGRYWVPHWNKATHWIAYWDTFGQPAAKPRYDRGVPNTWWWDADKAARLERAG